MLKHGVIDFSKEKDKDVRLKLMYESIKKIIAKEKPDFVVIEETQFQSNPKVLRTLAQLQGLIIALSYELSFGLIFVEPATWKTFVGIKSRKREEQKLETINIVEKRYKLKNLSEDESDSIAIGMWATNNLI